jgi:two-component system sensor histidine kinase and response regulator WspE
LGKQVRFEIRASAHRSTATFWKSWMRRWAICCAMRWTMAGKPEERRTAGKPPEGVIRLAASHHAGALQIVVSDDGRGIDPETIRAAVIARGLAGAETAERLSESELLEFLFLPGFSMKEDVTDLSGRGVGLDVVQEMIRQVRGWCASLAPGEGTSFKLELPLTLSVVRALAGGHRGRALCLPLCPYRRALKVPPQQLRKVEGRQQYRHRWQAVGLVGAHQVLGCAPVDSAADELCVVCLARRDEFAVAG